MRLINVFVFFTLGLGLFAQNDNNANGPTGQITSAEMRIKGLVGTTYVISTVNALKKIPQVADVRNLNVEHGSMVVALKKDNELSFQELQDKLFSAIKSGGCLCDAIGKVSIESMIKKDSYGFFVSIAHEKIYLGLLAKKAPRRLSKKIEKWFKNGSWVIATGLLHKHDNNTLGMSDTIIEEL
ncbi:hypothetical protein K2W90_04075 [Candidatus Babeliales bacterium]|nr:hypothetical protein [Candidatus Babeliales bacterium]